MKRSAKNKLKGSRMYVANATTAPPKNLSTNIKNACKKGENVMPHCIDAVKNLATLQEICDIYREVYGEYRDPGLY